MVVMSYHHLKVEPGELYAVRGFQLQLHGESGGTCFSQVPMGV
jgi:hypothetical protein